MGREIEARPICFFTGGTIASNVVRLLNNLGQMLSKEREIHLVTTSPSEHGLSISTYYTVNEFDCRNTLMGSLSALRTYLGVHQPACLVQLTRPPIHGTIVGTAARRSEVPFVYRYSGDRFHEYRVAQGTTRLTAFAVGELLGQVPLYLADQYITLGPTGRDRLTARGVNFDEVTILPPAVDATPFREAKPADINVPAERHVALFVGRFSHLKGITTLEQTIPKVLAHRDDIQFVFIGEEEREPDIPEQFREHVTLVGRVPPETIPAYMKAADVLIHPSLTDGIPRVVMESLAAGTPVLARNVGDVASVTENTFETDEEFVERLSSFENLPIDDISPFTVEALAPRYRAFFKQFQ
jgi:glycosyltransferase involved in cell wall biosynthesis